MEHKPKHKTKLAMYGLLAITIIGLGVFTVIFIQSFSNYHNKEHELSSLDFMEFFEDLGPDLESATIEIPLQRHSYVRDSGFAGTVSYFTHEDSAFFKKQETDVPLNTLGLETFIRSKYNTITREKADSIKSNPGLFNETGNCFYSISYPAFSVNLKSILVTLNHYCGSNSYQEVVLYEKEKEGWQRKKVIEHKPG